MNERPATYDDAEAVAALIGAYDTAHGVPADVAAGDLRHEWRDLELERDAWIVEVDGRPAAFGAVQGAGPELLDLDGYVHPDFAGRGFGAELLRAGERRIRERGAVRIHTATLHADERGKALLEAHGYAFVRAFLRMGIELERRPLTPELPDGLELVQLSAADDAEVHAAIEEAFVDHWGHEPRGLAAWRARREGDDRALWFGVRDGAELAGVSVNDVRFGAGWIGTLGTRRPWRGRGVAQALLLASFGEFWRRGERSVRLAVDATNPTGAVMLYERVGMRVMWRADVYEKRL